MEYVIEAKALPLFASKKPGQFEALSFQLREGEGLGIWMEGIEKSSFWQSLFLDPRDLRTKGSFFIKGQPWGKNNVSALQFTGVFDPTTLSLEGSLTVQENLLLFAYYKGLSISQAQLEIYEFLKDLGLYGKKDISVEELCSEERLLFLLARSFLGTPDSAILIGMGFGFSSENKNKSFQFLKNRRGKGCTMLFLNSCFDFVESFCNSVLFCDEHHCFFQGNPQEIMENFVGSNICKYSSAYEDLGYYKKRVQELGFDSSVIGETLFLSRMDPSKKEILLKTFGKGTLVFQKSNLMDAYLWIKSKNL